MRIRSETLVRVNPPAEQEVNVSASGQGDAVGYEADVKPLFREKDRSSMLRAFDLWSYDDVSRHADAIFARLEEGTMPCDGAWPPERVDVVRRWRAQGTPR
jgi:hypothetical protein